MSDKGTPSGEGDDTSPPRPAPRTTESVPSSSQWVESAAVRNLAGDLQDLSTVRYSPSPAGDYGDNEDETERDLDADDDGDEAEDAGGSTEDGSSDKEGHGGTAVIPLSRHSKDNGPSLSLAPGFFT